jgi:hypothetical protein
VTFDGQKDRGENSCAKCICSGSGDCCQ